MFVVVVVDTAAAAAVVVVVVAMLCNVVFASFYYGWFLFSVAIDQLFFAVVNGVIGVCKRNGSW